MRVPWTDFRGRYSCRLCCTTASPEKKNPPRQDRLLRKHTDIPVYEDRERQVACRFPSNILCVDSSNSCLILKHDSYRLVCVTSLISSNFSFIFRNSSVDTGTILSLAYSSILLHFLCASDTAKMQSRLCSDIDKDYSRCYNSFVCINIRPL